MFCNLQNGHSWGFNMNNCLLTPSTLEYSQVCLLHFYIMIEFKSSETKTSLKCIIACCSGGFLTLILTAFTGCHILPLLLPWNLSKHHHFFYARGKNLINLGFEIKRFWATLFFRNRRKLWRFLHNAKTCSSCIRMWVFEKIHHILAF